MEVPLIHRLYTGGQDGRYLAPEVSLCNAFGMKVKLSCPLPSSSPARCCSPLTLSSSPPLPSLISPHANNTIVPSSLFRDLPSSWLLYFPHFVAVKIALTLTGHLWKADVYGCALVMWEMCSGKQPFGISDIKKVREVMRGRKIRRKGIGQGERDVCVRGGDESDRRQTHLEIGKLSWQDGGGIFILKLCEEQGKEEERRKGLHGQEKGDGRRRRKG
eukprot:755710-Hanusia_phi.AAC.3